MPTPTAQLLRRHRLIHRERPPSCLKTSTSFPAQPRPYGWQARPAHIRSLESQQPVARDQWPVISHDCASEGAQHALKNPGAFSRKSQLLAEPSLDPRLSTLDRAPPQKSWQSWSSCSFRQQSQRATRERLCHQWQSRPGHLGHLSRPRATQRPSFNDK